MIKNMKRFAFVGFIFVILVGGSLLIFGGKQHGYATRYIDSATKVMDAGASTTGQNLELAVLTAQLGYVGAIRHEINAGVLFLIGFGLIIYGVCAWQKFNDHEDWIGLQVELRNFIADQKMFLVEKSDMDKYLFEQAKEWYKQNQKPKEE